MNQVSTIAPLALRPASSVAWLKQTNAYPQLITAMLWSEENQKDQFHGPLLHHILQGIEGGVTARDIEVASAVVQWFGTNCGGAFLAKLRKRLQDEGYNMF